MRRHLDWRWLPGHRPSRFGYLGLSLPPGGMPADQADTYALLLDRLGIQRAAIVGYSAGGPSAIQFALRHPDRTTGLVLLAAALPGPAGQPPKPIAPLLFTDLAFWTLKTYLPALLLRSLGMPRGFHPTPQQRIGILESQQSLFPIAPRKPGTLYDLYVANPDVQRYRLEELRVPTLLIHAKDDSLAAFGNSARAAERIPGAQLLAIDHGGHLLLGSQQRICQQVTSFLAASRVSERHAAQPNAPARKPGRLRRERALRSATCVLIHGRSLSSAGVPRRSAPSGRLRATSSSTLAGLAPTRIIA